MRDRLLRRLAWFVALTLLTLAVRPSASLGAGADWSKLGRHPDAWLQSDEGRAAVANVLSHQTDRGDWPKGVDTTASPFRGDRKSIQGTFDNGATVGEARFLARAYRVTNDLACREAVVKTINHVLDAQYPSGGWPQFHPSGNKYHKYVTFNDNTMVALMTLLRDAADGGDFEFLGPARREAAGRAFDAGVGYIIKSQVVVDGVKTVWCAQHDEVTFEPRPARTFEPVSLSGAESAGVLLLLMGLERPSREMVEAVEAGARWFDSVKLTGIKQVVVDGDKRIVPDPDSPPLWARFYEIGTNRPIFCGRDGVIKYDIAAIEPERRNGYAWYGTAGAKVAERYKAWSTARK